MLSKPRVSEESRSAFASFRAEVERARVHVGIDEMKRPKFGAYAAEDCLYRGHSSKAHVLQPTLIRAANSANVKIALKGMTKRHRESALSEMHDLESQLFYEFAPRGRKLAPGVSTDWDILFLMRHHGVATRLLDWSQSFGVAMYFALNPWLNDRRLRERECDDLSDVGWAAPSIWVLNPYRLNMSEPGKPVNDIIAPRFLDGDDYDAESSYGDWLGDTTDPGMGWKLPRAIFPEVLNDRLNAQSGLFTIHGDLHDSLEELVGSEVVRQVTLPKQALDAALEFMIDAGMVESQLFPDLDALAKDLHRKYGIA